MSAVGGGASGASLRGLAETLSDTLDVLDVSGAVEGARFAAGARLGDNEGALLVLAPDDRRPDEAWREAFWEMKLVALGLVRASASGRDRLPVLHEVAVHPGTFEDRLAHALRRATEVLDLDAAVFAQVHDGQWAPWAVYDPTGDLVSPTPRPIDETFCAITCKSDGPFGIEDTSEGPLGIPRPASYLGAPVLAGGHCVGTFCVIGAEARETPFSDEERVFIEALARWIGVAFASREDARRLVAREADLASFFNGSRLGMGTVRLVEPSDIEFVSVNAAAAMAFGLTPPELSGKRASTLGLRGPLVQTWVQAARRAFDEGRGHRVEVEVDTTRGLRTLATTVTAVDDVDDPRFTFVVEDVTGRRVGASAPLAALVNQAPGALFAADAVGRYTTGRGRVLDQIGLDKGQVGRPLASILDAGPEGTDSIRAALAGHDAVWGLDVDGQIYAVRVGPHRNAAGEVVGLVGMVADVSEASAWDIGHAVTGASGTFLQHLNHELRSPLTAVLGYAELLGDETTPVDVSEVRDVIVRASERLLRALDDLQDLMLLGDADITATPTPTDVAACVASIADASREDAEAKQIALNVWTTLPGTPLLLDSGLFERVVRHLIDGAIASCVGARVDVRLESKDPSWIELTVSGGTLDGGPLGIAPALIQRLVQTMGGVSERSAGVPPKWTIRLPRRPAVMINLDDGARDGAQSEVPTVAVSNTAG